MKPLVNDGEEFKPHSISTELEHDKVVGFSYDAASRYDIQVIIASIGRFENGF